MDKKGYLEVGGDLEVNVKVIRIFLVMFYSFY